MVMYQISLLYDQLNHLYVFDNEYYVNRYEIRITINRDIYRIYHAASKITFYIIRLNPSQFITNAVFTFAHVTCVYVCIYKRACVSLDRLHV